MSLKGYFAPTANPISFAYDIDATKHQREVGTGYFDQVSTVINQGSSSTLAMSGSTEEAQFDGAAGIATLL